MGTGAHSSLSNVLEREFRVMYTQVRNSVGLLIIGILAIGSGASRGAPKKDDPVADEIKALQGTWRLVSIETGGKVLGPEGFGPNNLLVFAGNKCSTVIGRSKRTIECTFTIDPTKSPKWIDMKRSDDKVMWDGIYELKGDTLKVYLGSPGAGAQEHPDHGRRCGPSEGVWHSGGTEPVELAGDGRGVGRDQGDASAETARRPRDQMTKAVIADLEKSRKWE